MWKVEGLGNGFDGSTPLIVAPRKGNVEIAKLLIERGANINKTDITGQTPLHVACQNGREEMVKLLPERGADINKAIPVR